MYSRVLVPVIFDAPEKTKHQLEIARAITAEGGSITVMHVIEEIPPYAVSYLPPDYLAKSREAIIVELQKMAADLPNGHAAVVDGHSGRTITQYAKEHDSDCIIIASHRPGMQDLLLGSTATYVVRHAPTAVHVLRD